jgi:hypothetical protein
MIFLNDIVIEKHLVCRLLLFTSVGGGFVVCCVQFAIDSIDD